LLRKTFKTASSLNARLRPPAITEIEIEPVDLRIYDQFLEHEEVLLS
jgi:hypothetical protein